MLLSQRFKIKLFTLKVATARKVDASRNIVNVTKAEYYVLSFVYVMVVKIVMKIFI